MNDLVSSAKELWKRTRDWWQRLHLRSAPSNVSIAFPRAGANAYGTLRHLAGRLGPHARAMVFGGLVGAATCGAASVAYRRHSSAYDESARLFERLLQRYRTGSIYEQLLVRGFASPQQAADLNIKGDNLNEHGTSVVLQRQDVLMDAHREMERRFKRQPNWVRRWQVWRKRSPRTAHACGLDDSWLADARQQLYKSAPQN